MVCGEHGRFVTVFFFLREKKASWGLVYCFLQMFQG
jgi:hypothetical protein